MNRKFLKPGNRVRRRGSNQVMYVSKYIYKKHPLLGKYLSDYDVECVWYEDGIRKTGIFDTRLLDRLKG